MKNFYKAISVLYCTLLHTLVVQLRYCNWILNDIGSALKNIIPIGKECKALGGQCERWLDGFYVELGAGAVLTLMLLAWCTRTARRLSAQRRDAWHPSRLRRLFPLPQSRAHADSIADEDDLRSSANDLLGDRGDSRVLRGLSVAKGKKRATSRGYEGPAARDLDEDEDEAAVPRARMSPVLRSTLLAAEADNKA